MNRRVLLVFSSLIALSLIVSGCVVLALGGAAAGTGAYVFASGKLSFTTGHDISECHSAALSAFKDLGITVASDATDQLSGRIKGETSTGESVSVDLEPQPPLNTWIEIRVGFWGDRSKATKVADAIRRHLR